MSRVSRYPLSLDPSSLNPQIEFRSLISKLQGPQETWLSHVYVRLQIFGFFQALNHRVFADPEVFLFIQVSWIFLRFADLWVSFFKQLSTKRTTYQRFRPRTKSLPFKCVYYLLSSPRSESTPFRCVYCLLSILGLESKLYYKQINFCAAKWELFKCTFGT